MLFNKGSHEEASAFTLKKRLPFFLSQRCEVSPFKRIATTATQYTLRLTQVSLMTVEDVHSFAKDGRVPFLKG